MSIIASVIVPHPPMIIPNVGKGSESQVLKTIESYNKISDLISELKPDTLIISSPHAPLFLDGYYVSSGNNLTGDLSRFGDKEDYFNEEIDQELVDAIEKVAKEDNVTIGLRNEVLDHGTMVPLYFINKKHKYKIVVIGLSGQSLVDHYNMGIVIKKAVEKTNKRVVYVASGDLSHKLQEYGPYGFDEDGPIYDKRIMEDSKNADFYNYFNYSQSFLDKVAECGHPSFVMMAGALDGLDVETTFYSHEDITGVGYGILSYIPKEFNSRRLFKEKYLNEHKITISNDPYVSLAYKTINNYIKNNIIIDSNDVSKELLDNRAGVFVSIHKFGELRGCIGTFKPTRSCIAEEIIHNAISAATEDPRFDPITEEELEYLEINVDVLGETEEIKTKEELDPKRYGVIVTSGFKRGLLLPDLEGIDTVEEQIRIACRKAGITPNEDISLQRFEVVRHK